MVIRPLDGGIIFIVFDLRPLIWDFGENCTIVHGITSEPKKMCYHASIMTFSSISNRLTAISKGGLFDLPVCGVRWDVGV